MSGYFGPGEIVAIWIKRAHRGTMDRVEEARLIAGHGLANSADQGGWRQITIIDESAWRDAEKDLGMQLDPSARRANVMTRGLDLQNSRGRRLEMGGCDIAIGGENLPCSLMDAAQPGLRDALRPGWRAGVFGQILSGGVIRVGDTAEWHGSSTG